VKKRPLLPSSDDERDPPSRPEPEPAPSPPPAHKPKKPRAKKPVTTTIPNVSPRPVKKDKRTNSQPPPSNSPPEGDDGEESDVQVALPRPAAKKKSAATQPTGKATAAPSQGERKPKTPAEHADAIAPTKPKRKVNLGGGRGLLGGFGGLGGLGGLGASSINWGGENWGLECVWDSTYALQSRQGR
jgi:hypothetical protein